MRHKKQNHSLYTVDQVMSLFKRKIENIHEVIHDPILVQRAKRGDRKAFGQLYQKYLDAIYRYIFFKVNRDVQEAEDLCEIVFFKAWQGIEDFNKDKGSFKSWLYTIAHNTVIDHYKKHKREVALEEHIAQEEDLIEKISITQQFEYVIGVVEELPGEQRDCVILRFVNDLSITETARVMGKTEEAVRALQYRALKSLRKII